MINLRSQLRQKLLRYYFTNPKAEHYLRELAELLGLDPANLSRELAELTRQGLFLPRTRGRQKYFRLNQDHPLYEEFRSIIFKTVGVIGELRKALATLSGLAEAYLFGSFARNQQDPLSDIDVLLVGDIPGQKVEEKLGSLERKLHREINYTVMTPEEFRKRRAAKDPFLEDVFRHKRIDLLIRRRGKAVARLVPPPEEDQGLDPSRILACFREIRARIPGKLKIRELIEEGRRY